MLLSAWQKQRRILILQGESIQSFWNRCDERALRDGGVYIMVDMTQEEEDLNFLDEQESGRRPYLIMIDRQDVINWSVTYENGRERIAHATIRQMRQVPIPNGFGVELEAIYHVLRPNLVETYRLDKVGNKWVQTKVNEVRTSLPVVPHCLVRSNISSLCIGRLTAERAC